MASRLFALLLGNSGRVQNGQGWNVTNLGFVMLLCEFHVSVTRGHVRVIYVCSSMRVTGRCAHVPGTLIYVCRVRGQ